MLSSMRVEMPCILTVLLFLSFFFKSAAAEEVADYHSGSTQSEEYNIGIMVKSIQNAIDHPEQHDSLATIFEYGSDSRYYVMIRGWLMQELASAKSQLSASENTGTNNDTKEKIRRKVQFLQQATRGIDLE